MPRASQSLIFGQDRLLAEHGEAVSYRGSELLCVFQRGFDKDPRNEYDLGSDTEDECLIWIPLGEFRKLGDAGAPRAGETIGDGFSATWRIRQARSLGPLGWKLKAGSQQ